MKNKKEKDYKYIRMGYDGNLNPGMLLGRKCLPTTKRPFNINQDIPLFKGNRAISSLGRLPWESLRFLGTCIS